VEIDPDVTPGESETPTESETPVEDSLDPADVAVPAPTPESEEPVVPVEADPDVTPVDGEIDDNAAPVEPEQVPDPTAAADAPAEDPLAGDPADAETQPAEGDDVPPVEDGEAQQDEADLTEDDLAATVATMRAADEYFAEDGESASLAPEPALTVFGCNVPIGGKEAIGAVVSGGDYLLAVAGLFGLIVVRVRPKRRRKGE